MKDEELIKARIRDIGNRLQLQLGLDWLTITHKFVTCRPEELAGAETAGEWQYRQAVVTWNLQSMAVCYDTDLEAMVLHEYVHICLMPLWDSMPRPLQDKLELLNELATENCARMLSTLLGIDTLGHGQQ